MVKAVFLDIDNTLLDFNLCATSAMRQGLEEQGFSFEEAMFTETFSPINNSLWGKIERGELTREGLFAIRWNLVFAALGIDYDGPTFENRFRELLFTAAVPVAGALELTEYLHGKYTVCIASNAFHDQQVNRLKIAGIYPHVDHIFVSERLGANKPGKAFFDACFASLPGLRPDECVMIGDSLTADVAGGVNAGMQTIWFNHGKISVPDNCSADFIVDSLDEIKQIL